MMRVFCAGYSCVYLRRCDWYWSSAPLRLPLMYKNVEDNSSFQKESWENMLALPLQGWPQLHNAALSLFNLISFPLALKVVLIRLFRDDFLSALCENTIQMRGRCLNALFWLFCLCQRNAIYHNHDWKEIKRKKEREKREFVLWCIELFSGTVSLYHHQQPQQHF